MVIALRTQAADEQGPDGSAMARYAAAWAHSAVRAVDARRDTRAVLAHITRGGPAVAASLVLDAELVVSELVTNALRHAPGPCVLSLRLTDTELVITCCDTSPEAPTLRHPDSSRVGGHGLHLVHTVSRRVVVTLHDRGKQVSAYLRLARYDDTSAAGGAVMPGRRDAGPTRTAPKAPVGGTIVGEWRFSSDAGQDPGRGPGRNR